MADGTQLGDEERQRRIDALHTLANEQLGTSDDRPTAHAGAPFVSRAPAASRKSPSRIWITIGLVALALAITIGAVAKLHYQSAATVQTKPIPDPLVITAYLQIPPRSGCPAGAAVWSPDGTKIAITGFQRCGEQITSLPNGQFAQVPDQDGVLVVYDATNAHLLADVPLDKAVTAAAVPASVQGDSQALANVDYHYDDLIWSPDDQKIALAYSAGHLVAEHNGSNGALTQDEPYGSGLLLVEWARDAVRALPESAAASAGAARAVVWDLQSGTSTTISVPEAETYSWQGANLVAGASLPAATSETLPPVIAGPSGNPDGGQMFTMWQTGTVSRPAQCQSSAGQGAAPIETCCPVGAYYSAQFGAPAAWSPGGRYLVLGAAGNIGAAGEIPRSEVPGAVPVPNACKSLPSAAGLARLPVRDAAMRRIMAALVPAPSNPATQVPAGPSMAALIWSPDGKRLVSDVALGSAPQLAVLEVYDCASGEGTAIIRQQQFASPVSLFHRPQQVLSPELAWSPNSQRLLAYDNPSGVIEVFGPRSLSGGIAR